MSFDPVVAVGLCLFGMLVGLVIGAVIVIRVNRGIGPEW